MADAARAERLRGDMHRLLDNLSGYWPADAVAYVREEAGYGEYADALQNLVAIGIRDGIAVSERDYALVKRLIEDMRMSEDIIDLIGRVKGEGGGGLSEAAG